MDKVQDVDVEYKDIWTHHKQGMTRYHNAIIATGDLSNFNMN
jgi:NADH dehydrogenase FAD-containing subunit